MRINNALLGEVNDRLNKIQGVLKKVEVDEQFKRDVFVQMNRMYNYLRQKVEVENEYDPNYKMACELASFMNRIERELGPQE